MTIARSVQRLDHQLFGRVAAVRSPRLDRVLPILSSAADYSRLWLALSGLMAVSSRPAWRRGARRGVASLLVASGLTNSVGKLSVKRSRPLLETLPRRRRVRRTPITPAFPSGHAASAAAFATGAAMEAPELAVPLGALALSVAASRVWTGAHYPSDVLAGVLIGGSVAIALERWAVIPR